MSQHDEPGAGKAPGGRYDVIVIGAGMSGMYQLHCLRQLGLSVRVFEAGSGVGGTWYGGAPAYREQCDGVAAKGYEGFLLQ